MSLIRRGISELPYILAAHGITNVVISPGSRNAPLIIALAKFTGIKSVSITDERSGGYYALGISQQTGTPTALVCTSGTALLNYGPAIAEAYYQGIPLLVLSADRPPEWIDQNDGQTLRQNDVFKNFVKGSFTTPVETANEDDLWYFRRIINEAIALATKPFAGPVHINFPFREPLYQPLPQPETEPQKIKTHQNISPISRSLRDTISKAWVNTTKKLVICGMNHPDDLKTQLIRDLSKRKDTVVIAENISNVSGESMIENPDSFIAALSNNQCKEFQPEMLITLGGTIVSKRLKKYLRQYKPVQHWHIGINSNIIDTFQTLTDIIDSDVTSVLELITTLPENSSSYNEFARRQENQRAARHSEILRETDFSDLQTFQIIMDLLPENSNLHLANSTPVRYSQLFRSKAEINYYSNRGTSGIDGCVSTACGAAIANNRLQVAIVGDLGLIYDSNALWNRNLPGNIKIIVMHNNGGNIFRLIETSPEIEPVKEYFETPHNVDIEKLCEAYEVEVFKTNSLKGLTEIMPIFLKPNDSPGVLIIETDAAASANAFKTYYKKISLTNGL